MRNVLCEGLCELYRKERFVFMTGDLGFGALEPLKDTMGGDFINAGIAEQNMVSVAAGLSIGGFKAWVYSIAPFCFARPFEQIRNDVCLHGIPVKLVGNGGGYGYGVMGSSHHALEDYGSLLTLNGMHAFVPAFASDVKPIIARLSGFGHPAYLRLGRSELPSSLDHGRYAPWRKIVEGTGVVVLVVGTLAGPIIRAAHSLDESERPEVWVLTELPLGANKVPGEFMDAVSSCGRLLVVEEHVRHGSVGQEVSHYLSVAGRAPGVFRHLHALGYPSGSYGSQLFHRKECGLDAQNVIETCREMR